MPIPATWVLCSLKPTGISSPDDGTGLSEAEAVRVNEPRPTARAKAAATRRRDLGRRNLIHLSRDCEGKRGAAGLGARRAVTAGQRDSTRPPSMTKSAPVTALIPINLCRAMRGSLCKGQSDLAQRAAVDGPLGAGDLAGERGEQVGDDPCDVVGAAEPGGGPAAHLADEVVD